MYELCVLHRYPNNSIELRAKTFVLKKIYFSNLQYIFLEIITCMNKKKYLPPPPPSPPPPPPGVQVRAQDKFPCVFKIGHAHGGLGKVRVDNQGSFQVARQGLYQRCRMLGT